MTEVPNLSHADIQVIFQNTDAFFNAILMQAFCKGIYTGIIAITMWTVFSAKDTNCGLSSHMMVFVILCLYVLDTLTFAYEWSFYHWAFIDNGWNFWTVFLASYSFTPEYKRIQWVQGVSGAISTLAADTSMIWRCWIVWGQHWLIILLPMLCLLTGTVTKVFEVYNTFHNFQDNIPNQFYNGKIALWAILYISCIMATTLLCTLLIIYRIITVSHRGMGIQSFRSIIEIIVESALIYSIALLVYIILVAHNSPAKLYADILAVCARGIAPTLIVGRVAAGHARPDESWEGSISSSLRFGHHSEDQSQGTIESDVEGGTGSSEEGQSLVSPADSSEQDQGLGGQEDNTGQITYVEIV
ncbi:hypothetical protein EDD85DRAFT_958679 [Armillaria nabsnona]|nr:hypothetical protein EDD85DRAFT_958679 [Armillaria nabsnona]